MNFDYRGISGFDISTHQDSPLIAGHVDFQKMRDFGAWFCIHRASNGLTKDTDFDLNWPAMKGILPRSTYHYFNNVYEPKAQARAYWNVIKADPEGICWLDVEDRNGGAYWGWKYWYDFIEEFRMLSGLPYERIGIYTAYYYWIESTTSATTAQLSYFAKFPLWLAWYGLKGSDPLNPNYTLCMVPSPWISPLILQSGTPAIGKAAGVESEEIDYNQFNGGAVEFARHFTLTEPPPTNDGETMSQWYRVNATSGLNVRIGPGSSYAKSTEVSPLAYNERIETLVAPVGGWYKVASVYHSDGTLQAVLGDAWCSGAYLVETAAPVTPPPPTVERVPFTLTVAGYKPYSGELEKA